MICRTAALAAILLAAFVSAAAAQPPSTATLKAPNGSTIVISAPDIEGIGSTRIVLRGGAQVKAFDKATKACMDARADKIVVTLFGSPGSGVTADAQGPFRSVEFTGSPQIIYTTIDPETGKDVVTTATSTGATYNGMEQMAYLKGNVKIVNENPAVFEGPAIMTGEEATINLKPSLGPEEMRFRLKSTQGVSRIEATPRPKEEASKKQ